MNVVNRHFEENISFSLFIPRFINDQILHLVWNSGIDISKSIIFSKANFIQQNSTPTTGNAKIKTVKLRLDYYNFHIHTLKII